MIRTVVGPLTDADFAMRYTDSRFNLRYRDPRVWESNRFVAERRST